MYLVKCVNVYVDILCKEFNLNDPVSIHVNSKTIYNCLKGVDSNMLKYEIGSHTLCWVRGEGVPESYNILHN